MMYRTKLPVTYDNTDWALAHLNEITSRSNTQCWSEAENQIIACRLLTGQRQDLLLQTVSKIYDAVHEWSVAALNITNRKKKFRNKNQRSVNKYRGRLNVVISGGDQAGSVFDTEYSIEIHPPTLVNIKLL